MNREPVTEATAVGSAQLEEAARLLADFVDAQATSVEDDEDFAAWVTIRDALKWLAAYYQQPAYDAYEIMELVSECRSVPEFLKTGKRVPLDAASSSAHTAGGDSNV